jgi:RNA binding exosome subunit
VDNGITLGLPDLGMILALGFIGNLLSIQWIRFRDQVKKRQMMENFLAHIQEKIETEEEFQEIIDKMRKDFGSEQ